jgi:hypothetical protein
LINTSRQIGGAIGIAATSAIAAAATNRYSDASVTSLAALDRGYQTALAVLTGLLLLGAAVAALFVRTAEVTDEQTSALPESALLDEAA